MAVIYVREQGAVVRKRGGRILVEKDGDTLLELPLKDLDAVAVFGRVQVTTQALTMLLERGISVAILSRTGRLRGRLVGPLGKNIPLRLAQYQAATNAGRRLGFAQTIVASKVRAQAVVVESYWRRYSAAQLAHIPERLRELAAEAAGEEEAGLLGKEGAAAAIYFGAWPHLNRSEFPFEGRRKHPATDPINALLSLGYTMVLQELEALVETAGLDPYLGFLHRPDYGRTSLALDLLEMFRAPLVDRFVLRTVNLSSFAADDFGRKMNAESEGGVVLTPGALREFLAVWEREILERRWRERMRETVAALVRSLKAESEFEGYSDAETDFI